jgi:hypothetical protein
MKIYGRVGVQIHIFLTSTLVEGQWSASHPGCSTLGKEPAVPIEQEVDLAPELVCTTWQEKKSAPTGTQAPTPWLSSP